MELDYIIDQIFPISHSAKNILFSHIKEIHNPKGTLLLKANKIEKTIYFLKKGIARAYADVEGMEITFWFGVEGDPILSMKSYVENQKSYENIELLEDCTLYKISTIKLQQLYNGSIEIANWGRRLAEKELVKTEERLISRQFRTATERYKDLLETNPDLLQRIALRHIASYLGITQVSLSRIRADIR
ncbi:MULTISPECIES: Crp/Fnr family transcriptional regulator [Chitinophagaceae]